MAQKQGSGWVETVSEGEKERYTLRGERENSNSNSKTLILKDSSIRSIWTYLTASPCYSTNTSKHDDTTNRYYKQLINAVSQSSYTCAETSELNSSHEIQAGLRTCIQQSHF